MLSSLAVDLRAARPDDGAAAGELLFDTGPAMQRVVLGGGDEEVARRFLEHGFRAARGCFSHVHGVVAEVGGEVGGVALAYPAADKPEEDRELARLAIAWFPVLAATRLFATGMRVAPLFGTIPPDAYYLASLGVRADLRGRGIGAALISRVVEEARRRGHPRCALHVAVDNPGARRLYERFGFSAIHAARRPALERRLGVPGQLTLSLSLVG